MAECIIGIRQKQNAFRDFVVMKDTFQKQKKQKSE